MQPEHINFLERETERVKPRNTPKRVGVFFLIGLLILSGIFVYDRVTHTVENNPLAYDPVTLEPKQPEGLFKKITYFVFNRGNEPLQGAKKDRINILLLGMGGAGHDGPYLSDTMIIASINPENNKIALISIPRDLGVDIPGYGRYKINHANAFGENEKNGWGGALATEVVESTFGMDIHYYIRLDFKAFEEIIDEIGGIKVNVERSFTDPMFPASGEEYQTVSFTAGVQTMNGKTALKYARSRHGNNGEGSDFARAKRQQTILLALKEKLLSFSTLANPVRINNIMKSLDRHMTTNMEFAEILSFVKLAREMEVNEIKTLVLENGPNGFLKNSFTESGAYILEPVTGNFNEINAAIEHIFEAETAIVDTTPAQEAPVLSAANVEIQNGTWRAGLASRVRKRLEDTDFLVYAVGNTEQKPMEKSGIYKVSELAAEDTMQALQRELHIPIKQTPESGLTTATSTDILVILGDDFPE